MVREGVSRFVADQQGMGLVGQMVQTQARVMAYLDSFWVFSIMALASLPLILLMKKLVARGGPAVH
jgi:MFS transporter, DHA2 family, multidrug resistance protein